MLRFNHLIKKQIIFNKDKVCHHCLCPYLGLTLTPLKHSSSWPLLLVETSALTKPVRPCKSKTKESQKVIYFSQVRIVLFWKRLKVNCAFYNVSSLARSFCVSSHREKKNFERRENVSVAASVRSESLVVTAAL